jgi:hypothetical protein
LDEELMDRDADMYEESIGERGWCPEPIGELESAKRRAEELDDEYQTTTFAPLEETENPKVVWGEAKAGFFGIPAVAEIAMGNVMVGGGYKYGKFNYRETRTAASTYHDAIRRHFLLWFDGEDNDPTDTTPPGSGESHLAHIMSCCALLLDAQENGMLDDDRSKTGKVREQLDRAASALTAFKQAHDEFTEN